MTQCGDCGGTLRPGSPGDCCVSKTFGDRYSRDQKTISDLRGHVGSLKERLRIAEADLEEHRKSSAWYSQEHVIRLLERAKAETRAEERERLNTPETIDFIEGLKLEAAHQRERWGSEHDAGKTDPDWFWLVGYLVGKALHKPEKRLHHLITAAAALFNWHLFTLGKTDMRPGIEPPAGDVP